MQVTSSHPKLCILVDIVPHPENRWSMRIQSFRRYFISLCGMLLLLTPACRNEKAIESAKNNAADFSRARCECEKAVKEKPRGDVARCTEKMRLARRYWNINMELGKLGASERQEIEKHAEKVYAECSK